MQLLSSQLSVFVSSQCCTMVLYDEMYNDALQPQVLSYHMIPWSSVIVHRVIQATHGAGRSLSVESGEPQLAGLSIQKAAGGGGSCRGEKRRS